MIVDSSAIVAVVMQEPGYGRIKDALSEPGPLSAGTPTLFECGLVLCARFGHKGRDMLHSFTRDAELHAVAFGEHHRDLAVSAFLQYGKGRHPARLNYGDCMTYAVARWSGEPLLCVGDDFAKTDLELVA